MEERQRRWVFGLLGVLSLVPALYLFLSATLGPGLCDSGDCERWDGAQQPIAYAVIAIWFTGVVTGWRGQMRVCAALLFAALVLFGVWVDLVDV